MATDEAAWSLAVTAPQSEQKAVDELARIGKTAFYFKHKVTKVRRGRKEECLVPAWPRYVFVAGYWGEALKTNHVCDCLRVGIEPAVIDASVVDRYRALADADLVLPLPVMPSRFQFGDRVMIQGDSILSGHDAIFQHMLGRDDKACVLQSWFGAMVQVEVNEPDLMPIREFRRNKRRAQRERRRRWRGAHTAPVRRDRTIEPLNCGV